MSDLPGLRFTPLAQFAAVDEPGAEPLASAAGGGVVIPAGGVVIVYGAGGAGKTTLVLDLCFALAAGDSWLGLVEPDRRLRVAIVENEGPRPEFRRKLRAKLAATDLEPGSLISVLEDPWSELTLASEQHRRALALALAELDVDLLVLGPLVSAGEFPNGGTPDEIRRFEQHVHELRALVERQFSLVLVHHENRAGQVSGAWERLPDTLIHVTPQGHGRTRVFWQKARWASELHGTSAHLIWADGETYQVERRPEVTEDTMRDELVTAIREHGGLSWTKLRDLKVDGDRVVRGRADDLADVRDRLLAEGLAVNVAPRDGAYLLWHVDDPACPRSHAGTGRERLPFPSPADDSEADPVPVPGLIGNGRNGNGTDEPEDAVREELEWH